MITAITFTAYGDPVPQGAIRSFGTGRPSVHANQDKLLPWRSHVQIMAEHAAEGFGSILGPVLVTMHFTVAKPKTAPKRKTTWPIKRPDIDHLVRACGDAITASGVWKDDSQVIALEARKFYPDEGEGALSRPGVRITITTPDWGIA